MEICIKSKITWNNFLSTQRHDEDSANKFAPYGRTSVVFSYICANILFLDIEKIKIIKVLYIMPYFVYNVLCTNSNTWLVPGITIE